MQRVTKDMTSVVRSMEGALKSMNLEQISNMLDRFEKSFENLDVQSQVMEETVGGVTAQSVPEASVQVGRSIVGRFFRLFSVADARDSGRTRAGIEHGDSRRSADSNRHGYWRPGRIEPATRCFETDLGRSFS